MPEDSRARSIAEWWVKEGQAQLELVLWAAWDPIGSCVPLNEYESYAPQIFQLLREGATVEQIAEELGSHRTGAMGLPPSPQADLQAAWKLDEWHHWVVEPLLED